MYRKNRGSPAGGSSSCPDMRKTAELVDSVRWEMDVQERKWVGENVRS